ncbi:MAG: glycosyltransferase family 39 protein, partial [Vicinamibacterales bacterium]
FYALFAWEGLAFVAGLVMGWWDSLAAFQREFFVDPSRLYWSGRLLTALCGAATIAAVAAGTARLSGRAAGLIAATIMAITPIAVMDAHYVKHDVPVTLLIVLVHVILARMLMVDGPAFRRDVWMAGALSGLAISTHYYAIFVVLPVAATLLTKPGVLWPERMRDGVRAGLAAIVIFFAASPFLLPEIRTAWVDITQNRAIVMDRATAQAGWFPSLGTYLGLLRDFDVPVFLVAAVLLSYLVRGGRRRPLVLALFPVSFLLFISNTVPATRYLNPLLPFVAAAIGAGVLHIAVSFSGAWKWAAWVMLALTPFAFGLLTSVTVGTFFQQPDTRTLAQQWIEAQVPAGSTVLIQPYSVPLRQSREGLIEALRATLGSEDRATVKFRQQLALAPYPAPAYRTIYLGDGGLDKDKIYVSPGAFTGHQTLAPLKALGVQYVVLKRYNVADASLASLDEALASGGHLVATFSPYRSDADPGRRAAVAPFLHNTDARFNAALERPGPVIEIWRID